MLTAALHSNSTERCRRNMQENASVSPVTHEQIGLIVLCSFVPMLRMDYMHTFPAWIFHVKNNLENAEYNTTPISYISPVCFQNN